MFKINNQKTEQASNYDKALEILKKYNLDKDIYQKISEQIKLVITELEAIKQEVNPQEITLEVLEQNDITLIGGYNIEKRINLDKVDKAFNLRGETLNKVIIEAKSSNIKIDLREFEFSNNELSIELNTKTSNVEILINKNIFVKEWVNSKMSNIEFQYEDNGKKKVVKTFQEIPSIETNNTLNLEGNIKISSVKVLVDLK